jgi:hypothetical protein
MGASRTWAIVLASLVFAGCLKPMPPPPLRGYGDPYRGTGKTIFVKDSRGDWDITEGTVKITAEQALEASGDVEYERRRQLAKAHNAKLYREAKAHRRKGIYMIIGAALAVVGGAVIGYGIAPNMHDDQVTPPTAMDPEMVKQTASGGGLLVLGTALIYGGIGGIAYGYYGAWKKPPYVEWRVPDALNRPAYVRQHTEDYNEKLGGDEAPAITPSSVPLPRKPLKPQIPRPRGGRR